jgi:peroxisome-assembly ATPase
MPPGLHTSTGVTITNPLVLYRALISTGQIRPDASQYRLAVHLQKVYDRLKDYEPEIEYQHRISQLSQSIAENEAQPSVEARGLWTSLLEQKERKESLALTRTLTSHESAMELDSPKGLMLHGEVGTG